MLHSPWAVAAVSITVLALAWALLVIAGRMGKPGIRARALPPGTQPRPRSREEILHAFHLGCLELNRAEAEAAKGSARFARLASDLREAREQMEASLLEVGHA